MVAGGSACPALALSDALALARGGLVGPLGSRRFWLVEPGLEVRRASPRSTSAIMLAWLRPQSSAHWPVKIVPASLPGILNQVWFV